MDAVLHRSKQLLKILHSPFSMLYQREARSTSRRRSTNKMVYQREARSELSILNYQL